MNRFKLLTFFILLSVAVGAQNKDTVNISITDFSLHPGTFSWRGTGTFNDMTSWNSSPYTEGHLRHFANFRMNYRLLFPVDHNPNYEPGYPMIVMLHGGGERGNCWGNNCYCDGCNPNGAQDPNADVRFMNNDHNLVHGGSPHLTARNLAGNKLPDDPTLNPRAFPGFVFFPQMMNQWKNSNDPGNADLAMAIRIIRLLVKQYNIDPDRIYIHGLSFGGQAVLEAMNYADWLFAAAAPMSALVNPIELDSVRNIPMWFFQGGRDGEPTPGQTETAIRNLRERGANVRYTLYPTLGHGTWNTAYAEPDFFSWLLSHRKSNIHVDYNNPNICGTNGNGANLVLAQGFPAYQWERDGQIIPGATDHTYLATFPGVYRARFSRVSSNPSEAEWNRWSDPVVVGEKSPEVPVVTHEGTLIKSDLNTNLLSRARIPVQGPPGFEKYTWYFNGGPPQQGSVVNVGAPHEFELRGPTGAGQFQINGAYTLVVEGFDQCPSLPSAPKYAIWGTHNYLPPLIANRPTGLTYELISATSALFRWTDNSNDERGFELWRRKLLNVPGEQFGTGWVLAAQTAEDETMFLDSDLEPNSTYWYKLRAVNTHGRSRYFPGNEAQSHLDNVGNVNFSLVVTTGSPATPPIPPTNLIAETISESSIRLTWEPPSNQTEIAQYVINNNGNVIETNSKDTTFTVSSLTFNSVYTFTVSSKYANGTVSEPSNPAVAHTYIEGLFYKHSTGAWGDLDELTLQATYVNPEFTGWVPAFTLAPRTQEDFFNFEFSGYFYVPNSARYQFRIGSDDGSRLFIGDQTVNNDGLHGMQYRESQEVVLHEGPIPIKVWFFENGGGQDLVVQYRRRPINSNTFNPNWTTIPASMLRSGTPPPPPTPPPTPTNAVANATGMQTIDLNWDHDNLDIVVLGSSTAFGTGANPINTNSWVNLLSAWLADNTTGTTVTNLAMGGFTTEDVLETGDPARNITHALSLNPDIIVVNLPSNDVAENIDPQQTIDNLQTIYDLAAGAGVKMFITTTQPRDFADANKREQLYMSASDIRATFGEWAIDIYDELADLSTYTIKPSYGSGDGIHLNNTGHAYIFNTVRDKLALYIPSFEIQRSLSSSGPFATIARTMTTDYGDAGLVPDITYYYQVRTTSINAVSPFTPVFSATTFPDNVVPTQPGAPTLLNKSFSTASFNWTPVSTDNVQVKGYEVYQDGQYIGFTPVNAFFASDLDPGVQYSFHVVAVDLNDNKSAASPNLQVTTNLGQTFTTKANATVLNDISSWENGGGQSPASFNHNGQTFLVQHGLPVNNTWSVQGSVSKVVIDDNVTVNIGANPIYAKLDIPGNGILNVGNAQIPEFGTLSESSTVNYTYKFIKQADYGNLSLTGTGAFTFPTGTTRVRGNLIAANGTSLKGASGNTTNIELFGNLTVNGTPEALASGFGINLQLAGNGNQNIQTSGTLDLFRLSKTGTGNITLLGSGSPVTLNLGSTAGGGLSIPSGSTFNLGDNQLAVLWAGTINSADEGGLLSVNDGSLSITSTSASSSHLRFSNGGNTVHTLAQNLTGAGSVQVHNAVNISDGVKITAGDLHANGNVTLLSTELKTANLQEIENNGRVLGAMNVQRYMSNKTRTYRYISSSVENVTISDWQDFFPITGNFPGTSTGPGLTTQASLFRYETTGWQAYPRAALPSPYNDSNAPIERGLGYAAFVRNNTPVLIQTSGVPYQGEIEFPVFPAQGGNALNDWNLLGNPYASTIRWSNDPEAWDKTDVGSVIAVRNNFNTTSGQFQYFDAETELGTGEGGTLDGGRIAPGQAFWVQATGPNAAVTIRERAKDTGQQTLYRDGAPNISHLRIKLTQGAKTDAALLLITELGTDNYDPAFDGLKMGNEGIFNLSTLTADDHSLAINKLGNSFCSKTVMLNITGTTPGTYSLIIDSPETLFGVGSISLKDNFTNSTVVVDGSTTYAFAVTSDPASFGKTRFELILDRPEINTDVITQLDNTCGEAPQITLSNTKAGVTYAIYRGDVALTNEITSVGEDLLMTIPVSVLAQGENRLSVKASFKGCGSEMIADAAVFNHYAQPSIESQTVSVCEGSSATLTASPRGEVAGYQWYNEGGKIKGATGAVYETEAIFFDKYYYVQAIDPNGCAGPKTTMTVSPELLDVPEIVFTSDTMSTVAVAQEYIWARNGEPIHSSTTDPRFTPSADGSYTLTVRKGGCLRTSREQVVTGVESESFSSFQLYPNPTTSRNINLRYAGSAGNGVVIVRIVDVVGKEVYNKPYENIGDGGELRIEPSQRLAKGVYLMTIEHTAGQQQIRFIIEE